MKSGHQNDALLMHKGPTHMGRTGKRLNLLPRLSQVQASEGLTGTEGLENFLKSSVPMGLETGQQVGQALSHLPNLALGLGEREGKGKPNLVGETFRGAGREDASEIPERESPTECILQHLVRFTERRPEN